MSETLPLFSSPLPKFLEQVERRVDERTTLAGLSVEDYRSRIPMEPAIVTHMCRELRKRAVTIGSRLRTLKTTYGSVYRGGVAHRLEAGVEGVVVQMNRVDYDDGIEITMACDDTYRMISLTKAEEYEVIG